MNKVLILLLLVAYSSLNGQSAIEKIHHLIDQYSIARERKDTNLLKTILTSEIDQLVSTGEWRRGLPASIQGMLRSSAAASGNRILVVDHIRFISESAAIVDAKYEVPNADGSIRKMWSTFVVVSQAGAWRISAIRNMLPTPN